MASETQSKYIADLAVKKTKEFKEVKELLIASNIVGDQAETVKDAETIAAITDALTDLQASQFIDLLTSMKDPARGVTYSKKRIVATSDLMGDIKGDIDSWDFS